MKREWVRVGGGWGQVSTNRQTVVDKVRENRSGGEIEGFVNDGFII